ncbi:hypothetical protein ACXYMP_04435 [Aliiroseovarius sp. CAU 1755]
MAEIDRHFKITETRDQDIVIFEEQYKSLRKEILERQQRRFYIVAGAALGIPSVSGLKISGVMEGAFMYVVPLVVVAMSFLFLIEVNGIARAGDFIDSRIENQFKGVAGWEHYLKDLRKAERLNPPIVQAANASFILLMAVYFLFSVLVSSWRLLFFNSGEAATFIDAVQTKSAIWAMLYLVLCLCGFFAWLFGMKPYLRFSAEEHKPDPANRMAD